MSFLADIIDFWDDTATLDTALDHSKVFVGAQPETAPGMPYAVIETVGQVTDYDVCGSIESFTFQIHIWHTRLEDAEALADTVQGVFDDNFAGLTSKLIGIWRDNRLALPDTTSTRRAWRVILQYTLKASR